MTVKKHAEFVVGDVVWMKSGGPAMTVAEVLTGPFGVTKDLRVYWFTTQDEVMEDEIPAVCCEKGEE